MKQRKYNLCISSCLATPNTLAMIRTLKNCWPKPTYNEPIGPIKRPQLVFISAPILLLGVVLCHYGYGDLWYVALPTFLSLLHVVFCFIEMTASQAD